MSNMICLFCLCLGILIVIRLFLDRKEGTSLWLNIPQGIETISSIISPFASLNFDNEHTGCYSVGLHEAQINTVTDTNWDNEGVKQPTK